MPEYWPTYNSEKKMGRAIINTISTKGMRKAPAMESERNISIQSSKSLVSCGFIKICQILIPSHFRCLTTNGGRRATRRQDDGMRRVKNEDDVECDNRMGYCLRKMLLSWTILVRRRRQRNAKRVGNANTFPSPT